MAPKAATSGLDEVTFKFLMEVGIAGEPNSKTFSDMAAKSPDTVNALRKRWGRLLKRYEQLGGGATTTSKDEDEVESDGEEKTKGKKGTKRKTDGEEVKAVKKSKKNTVVKTESKEGGEAA